MSYVAFSRASLDNYVMGLICRDVRLLEILNIRITQVLAWITESIGTRIDTLSDGGILSNSVAINSVAFSRQTTMYSRKGVKSTLLICVLSTVVLYWLVITGRDDISYAPRDNSDFVLPDEDVDYSVFDYRTFVNNSAQWASFNALKPWLNNRNDNESAVPYSTDAKRLPSVICIGAKKCGTAALTYLMSAHPNFKAAKGEVHFFGSTLFETEGFEAYRKRMPESGPGDIVFERSPGYFLGRTVPAQMRRWNRGLKLVLLLCDPVLRTFSDFKHMRRAGETYQMNLMNQFKTFESHVNSAISDVAKIERDPRGTLGYATFHSFLKNAWNERTYQLTSLTVGLYHYHLREWYIYFPPEQIYIVDGDELVRNPFKEVKKLEKFMGLSDFITEDMYYYNATKGFYCVKALGCLPGNKGNTRKEEGPKMNESTRDKLRRFFKPHNEKLFKLIRREFDWS